ncbi:MAG: hypothetical protein ABIO81_10085 [Ginsengibacter sp.]
MNGNTINHRAMALPPVWLEAIIFTIPMFAKVNVATGNQTTVKNY